MISVAERVHCRDHRHARSVFTRPLNHAIDQCPARKRPCHVVDKNNPSLGRLHPGKGGVLPPHPTMDNLDHLCSLRNERGCTLLITCTNNEDDLIDGWRLDERSQCIGEERSASDRKVDFVLPCSDPCPFTGSKKNGCNPRLHPFFVLPLFIQKQWSPSP